MPTPKIPHRFLLNRNYPWKRKSPPPMHRVKEPVDYVTHLHGIPFYVTATPTRTKEEHLRLLWSDFHQRLCPPPMPPHRFTRSPHQYGIGGAWEDPKAPDTTPPPPGTTRYSFQIPPVPHHGLTVPPLSFFAESPAGKTPHKEARNRWEHHARAYLAAASLDEPEPLCLPPPLEPSAYLPRGSVARYIGRASKLPPLAITPPPPLLVKPYEPKPRKPRRRKSPH